jgi:type VI protein secretion system component Hcp
VQAPRDLATGQASGKRQWKPVTLMMPMQTCVPRLSQAVSKNEQLAVTIDFTPADPSKSPHKLVLTNAMSRR